MTSMEIKAKGYDDSAHLEEMAAGLVVRKYASV